MNPIVINGTVLCDNITGIPRYVYENVVRLDKLIEGTGLDVRIAYRDDGRPIHLPELKNIRLVPLKSIPYFYNLVVLPAYLHRTHAFYVGLASDMLLTRRSVVVLHDIRPLVMDTDKGFFRFKFWVHCLSTKWFAQRVFTVSDNQRHLISEKLGIPLDKIGITYNGWEHMKNVTPDESIFDKMPGVKKGEYFYALGSLAKHKNFKWIREVARPQPRQDVCRRGRQGPACLWRRRRGEGHPQCVLPGLCVRCRERRADEALQAVFAPRRVRGLWHPAAGGAGPGCAGRAGQRHLPARAVRRYSAVF